MSSAPRAKGVAALAFESLRRPVGPDYRGLRSFGWLILLLLVLELVTGGLLTVYYEPVSERAPASLRALMRDVHWGWLVRGLHQWTSQALLVLALALGLRELFTGGYRGRRASLWALGCIVFGLLIAATFTGALLRWDEPAGGLLERSLAALRGFPFLGRAFAGLLAGGSEVGPATLERLHAIHVFLLPCALAAVLIAGLWIFVRLRESAAGAASG